MSQFPANTVIDLPFPVAREDVLQDGHIEEEVLDLFDSLGVRLLRYAVSFGISIQDGEDIVQDVFLALFRHLRQQRSRENLQGWLYQVTHNLALKRRLKQMTETAGHDTAFADGLDPSPDPEERLLFRERHARLQAALHALPSVDQSCLRLRAEGLRYREISKVLGISLGSVAASLARSLARLERAERR